jgi:hypothetical protein
MMKAALLAMLIGIHSVNAWAQSVPASTDSRRLAWVDPRQAYYSFPLGWQGVQVGTSTPDLSRLSEPGWWDSKVSQYTVMHGADPADGSKKAFRHKIVKGMVYTSGTTARASIYAGWGAPPCLVDGQGYWVAFAFYVDNDHPFNGTGGDMHILDLGHSVSSTNQLAMHTFFLRRDGQLELAVSSNTILNGTDATRKTTSFKVPVRKRVWNYIVIQTKLHWDINKGPYTRVWRAEGTGAPVQIVNSNVANAYRETAGYHPWKFGIYAWDVSTGMNGIWSTSPPSTSRTVYTKGTQILKDVAGTPTLSVSSMLQLMRSM